MEKCGRFVLYHNKLEQVFLKAMTDREETLPVGRKDSGPTGKNDNDTKEDEQEFKE